MADYEGGVTDRKIRSSPTQARLRENVIDLGSAELLSVSIPLIIYLLMSDMCSHVNLQIYKSQQQLVSMIDNIKLDLEKRASQAIETRFQKPSDTYYHLEELKREASSLSSSIKNPVTRLGFEQAMDAALSVLSNSVNIYETPIRQEKTIVQSFSNSKLFTISTPFGSVHIRTVTILFADCSYKLRSTITMHPSRFLQLCGVKFGIKFALSQSYGSLTHTLKGYRAVPDDAAIFKLCKEGRTDAISHLFDEGHASPFDTDSFGRTPLMVCISIFPNSSTTRSISTVCVLIDSLPI